MRATVFIGHHKVGSTALQHGLAAGAAALLKQGVLYPATDFAGLAHLAAAMGGWRDSVPLCYAEGHNALGFKMIAEGGGGPVPAHHPNLPHSTQMARAIAEQVARFGAEHVVLASEVFSNFGALDAGLIDRIAQIVGPHAKIVATLRRPDDYIVSWHHQRLRFGHRPKHLSDEIRDYSGTIHLDYRMMLAPWVARFGAGCVDVTPYQEIEDAGGALAHFAKSAGLTAIAAEPRLNSGLHRGFGEIARRVAVEIDGADLPKFLDWLRDVETEIDLPDSADIEILGREARRALRREFEPVHDWLSSLTGRASFFADIDQMTELKPVPESEVFASALFQLKARSDAPSMLGRL